MFPSTDLITATYAFNHNIPNPESLVVSLNQVFGKIDKFLIGFGPNQTKKVTITFPENQNLTLSFQISYTHTPNELTKVESLVASVTTPFSEWVKNLFSVPQSENRELNLTYMSPLPEYERAISCAPDYSSSLTYSLAPFPTKLKPKITFNADRLPIGTDPVTLKKTRDIYNHLMFHCQFNKSAPHSLKIAALESLSTLPLYTMLGLLFYSTVEYGIRALFDISPSSSLHDEL